MASLSRRQRRVAGALVVAGALASIATTAPYRPTSVSIDLPLLELGVDQPSVTRTLHVHVGGDAKGFTSSLEMYASRTAGVPTRMVVSTSDQRSSGAFLDDSNGSASLGLACNATPCDEDVRVRFDLLPGDDGKLPNTPATWMASVYVDISGDDVQGIKDGDVTVELRP